MRKGSVRRIAALMALLLLCLTGPVRVPALAEAEKGLEVYFFDLGRVDGILIRCDGVTCFIDVGYAECAKRALPWLKALGVKKLDCYVGTHAHADHIEGAPALIAALRPDVVYVPHRQVWAAIAECATRKQKKALKATSCQILKAGETFSIGGAAVHCLGPVTIHRCSADDNDENDNSLILKLTYGARSFLFTGDTTDKKLREANRKYPDALRCDVFKNPHHNGEHAADVLKLASPRAVVFCTDNENQPTREYLRHLKDRKCAAFITGSDNDGNVLFTSDGEKLDVFCGYPLKSVKLNQPDVMTPGQQARLTGRLKPRSLADAKKWLNWKSSDEGVAKVSGGVVTAVGEGTATITATAINGVSDSVQVRVVERGLVLDREMLSLKVGEAEALDVERLGGVPEGLEWASEDVGVAMVTADGEVIGMGVGETRVAVRASDGSEAACQVVVSENPVKSVKLSPGKLRLEVGDTGRLEVSFSPSDATDRRLEWASSDASVVTVDEFGNVTAVGRGTAKIGVRAASGAYDICKVKVK